MSTRTTVRIIKNGMVVNYYHHGDGYFSGVGKELQDWLKESKENSYHITKKGKKTKNYDMDVVFDKFLCKINADVSYQPTFYRHCDIEFFYLLDFDKKIFKAYKTCGANPDSNKPFCYMDPWHSENDERYDKTKPFFNQMPAFSIERDLVRSKMKDFYWKHE